MTEPLLKAKFRLAIVVKGKDFHYMNSHYDKIFTHLKFTQENHITKKGEKTWDKIEGLYWSGGGQMSIDYLSDKESEKFALWKEYWANFFPLEEPRIGDASLRDTTKLFKRVENSNTDYVYEPSGEIEKSYISVDLSFGFCRLYERGSILGNHNGRIEIKGIFKEKADRFVVGEKYIIEILEND